MALVDSLPRDAPGFRIFHIKRVLKEMSDQESERIGRMFSDKDDYALLISPDEVVKLCDRVGLELSHRQNAWGDYDICIVPRWIIEAIEQYSKMDGGFADLTIEEYLARMV